MILRHGLHHLLSNAFRVLSAQVALHPGDRGQLGCHFPTSPRQAVVVGKHALQSLKHVLMKSESCCVNHIMKLEFLTRGWGKQSFPLSVAGTPFLLLAFRPYLRILLSTKATRGAHQLTCHLPTGINEHQQAMLIGIYIRISSHRCHCISKMIISGEVAWHLFQSKRTHKLLVRCMCFTTLETIFLWA